MGCLRACGILAALVAMAVPALLFYAAVFTHYNGVIPALATERNFDLASLPDLSGTVALVTGANTGLGFANAKLLAQAGAKTVLACRSQTKCTAAAAAIRESKPGADLLTYELDLGSLASVRAMADNVLKDLKRVDMLVLNAGVMASPFAVTADGLEQQFGVNHVGHAYLTLKLLPLVRQAVAKAGKATITVVTGSVHYLVAPAQPGTSASGGVYLDEAELNKVSNYDPVMNYARSKLANVLFTHELSRRLRDGADKIYVNSVHPGFVATELARYVGESVFPSFSKEAVERISQALFSLAWTPEEAVLTQLYTECHPDIATKGITGHYFHPIAKMHPTSQLGYDANTQRKLWEFTDQILQTRGFTDYEAL
jgi:NAD(P)-dependent dehydrogenase (short-subunit alcohol dehydrogenase family)